MISFATKAEGGTVACDRGEVRRAIALLIRPGERHELRALPGGESVVVSGDDPDAAAAAAEGLCGRTVYYSVNPIRDGAPRARKSTVTEWVWLYLDVDSVRADHGSSATEDEKAAALLVATAIVDHLVSLGWPPPIVIDSGNGWHLLYRIRMGVDRLAQQLVKAATVRLAEMFDGPGGTLDRGVHDPSRVAKLPGSLARRGVHTAERPHRFCRLAYEPDRVADVTVDQLQALATPPATPGAAPVVGPAFATTATAGPGKSGYVRTAVEQECLRIATARPGGRNDALNRASFALGQFASWPEMDEAATRARLRLVAERAGLSEGEIVLTIASGWSAGSADPRPRPADPANGAPHGNGRPAVTPGTPIVVRASAVTPKVVRWLWPDRIAIGFITIFAGRTGLGKSFVLCDFIARLTSGRDLPSGEKVPPGNALVISEDPYDYVLCPRLREMGADLDRVGFLTWEAMASYSLSNTAMLDQAYVEAGSPILIAIDPPANFLGGKDEHKNAEVREVLMSLVAWLNKHSVAAVFVTHVNKQVGKGIEAVDRIMGSVAWASTSRIALGFTPDPNDAARCLFAGIKNNLGPKADTLAYVIRPTDTLAVIDWQGKVDISADDAMNATRQPRRVVAAEWLAERFRERRGWPSDDLYDLGRAEGVSKSAIWEAAQGLKEHLRRTYHNPQDGSRRYWEWIALPGWPEENNETLGTLGTLTPNSNDGNGHLSVPMSEGGRGARNAREADEGVSVPSVPRISPFQGERDRNAVGDDRRTNDLFKPF